MSLLQGPTPLKDPEVEGQAVVETMGSMRHVAGLSVRIQG